MSAKVNFPNPRYAQIVQDVIAMGGEVNSSNLFEAYSKGIFPWPHEGYPLLWFCPEERGIIFFEDLHLSQSFKKWLRKNESKLTITINQAFSKVIESCEKQIRPGQQGTWINEDIKKGYLEHFSNGGVVSVEVWLESELVGGIYGVQSKNYFSCESMFFKKSNMSKVAFIKLIEYLKKKNLFWMDLQMVTPVSEAFGACYISREEFLDLIDCPE